MNEQIKLLESEDEIQRLEIDLVKLHRDVEGQEEEKKVPSLFSSLKEKIASLRELKQKREAQMIRLQDVATRSAEKVLADLIRLDKERAEKIRHLRLCQLAFELNTPLKRQQISSSKMIWIERTVIEKKATGYLSLHGDTKGEPTFSEVETKQRTTVELHKLDLFLRDGWSVSPPDQDIDPEPLTGENSMLVPSVSMPEIFERARDLSGESYFSFDATEREIQDFAKSLK